MKQKKELFVLFVLLLTAGAIWFFYFERDKPVVTADASSVVKNFQLLSVENPSLHNDPVEKARKTEYKSTGRNIFSAIAATPPAPQGSGPKPNDPKHPIPPAPLPPAPAPVVAPLPVKFFGYGTIPSSASRRAFFTDGEDVYIVAEGEVLLNRFRILKIGNVNLEYEEIASGLRGTAPLEDQGAPPSA
jgi:hypothetical protein